MSGCECKIAEKLSVKVLYHNKTMTKIKNISVGDWTDLRSSDSLLLEKGDFRYIDLGISVQVPKGYELHIAPRSSTYKNFGIIQTNSVGVIDESYSGNKDVLKMPALAMRDTAIQVDARICQCRLVPKQPKISWDEVTTLENENRGGLGSTGTDKFVGNAKITE